MAISSGRGDDAGSSEEGSHPEHSKVLYIIA